VHLHTVSMHLKEDDVDATLEAPHSAELLHATSLVCRALHDTMAMRERKRPDSEDTEESTKVAEFTQDSKLPSRVRVLDKLVRKSLQARNMGRSASKKKL